MIGKECFVHTKWVPFAFIFGFVQFGAIQLSIVVRLQMGAKKWLWLEWEFDSAPLRLARVALSRVGLDSARLGLAKAVVA